jgi:hypothetical protein
VAFLTTVFVRWKAIFIEHLILQQQAVRAAMADGRNNGNSTRVEAYSVEDLERLLVPLDA